MNNNMIEIINFILKRMLKEGKMDQEEIISELIDKGYSLEDIDQAFAIILAGAEDTEESDYIFNENKKEYNRIFTLSEKLYLPQKLQGMIYRLLELNVLSPEKSEKLIHKTVKKVYKGSANTKDLWEVLNDLIDDEDKLELITNQIPEFNDYLQKEFKHIN